MDVSKIEIDSFVRSIGVNWDRPHTFFLGAGASVSSGVPSAERCIWEWKRSLYCTNNPGFEQQVSELSLPVVQDRIQSWLEANGVVPDKVQDPYSYYIEKCLPIRDDRRSYFEPWVRRARPHIGYRLLCLLAEADLVRSVWTTNFDGLVARAAADFDITPVEIGIDCTYRVFRQPARNELLCVSMHGDYRYDSLKNTSGELQTQDTELRSAFVDTLKTHSLVVSGYSGRDASVMEAIRDGLLQAGSAGKLFWCGFSETPTADVSDSASQPARPRERCLLCSRGIIDDAITRLAGHCSQGNHLDTARLLLGADDKTKLERSSFHISQLEPTAIIKSNAWPVQCPSELFEFDLREWPEHKVWKWLVSKTSGRDVVAVPFRNVVLALGTLDSIKDVFSDLINGDINRVPISDTELCYEDGAVVTLLRRALVQAIASQCDFATDGNRQLWRKEKLKTERHDDQRLAVHESARLALRNVSTTLRQFAFAFNVEPRGRRERRDRLKARN